MPRALPPKDKQSYREWVKASLPAMDDTARSVLSAAACANAVSLEAFMKANTVLAYKPVRGECSPDTLVAFARAQGKRVAFPLCIEGHRLALYIALTEDDFRRGAYGIPEPDPGRCTEVKPEDIDFAVIPGMAFDTSCNRMGRGAGYYDRLLAGFSGVKAGFAYQFQIFAAIPADEHDVKMDYVVTNNGIIVNNRQ